MVGVTIPQSIGLSVWLRFQLKQNHPPWLGNEGPHVRSLIENKTERCPSILQQGWIRRELHPTSKNRVWGGLEHCPCTFLRMDDAFGWTFFFVVVGWGGGGIGEKALHFGNKGKMIPAATSHPYAQVVSSSTARG